MALRSCSFV